MPNSWDVEVFFSGEILFFPKAFNCNQGSLSNNVPCYNIRFYYYLQITTSTPWTNGFPDVADKF